MRLAFLAALVGLVTGACSRGDELTTPDTVATTATPATIATTTDTRDASSVATPAGSSAPAPSPSSEPTTESSGSDQDDPPASESLVTTPRVSVVDVPEVGVPGLDSDDEFCSSWSRFAGSFQVVAVTSAFGSGSPDQLAALEVAAAPTVTAAYEQLVGNWPAELAAEADLVADEFLGPFARRLEVARTALHDVGADDATIDTIEQAWLAGLARRDPTTPEFVVDLPEELWTVIDDAATTFSEQRVPFAQDPSLVTEVETPLTSEYLAVSCPDQGTLSGQEIEAP